MARIARGDIFLADLQPTRGHEQAGKRPVLIVSNEIFNQSETVIAMAITGQSQRIPYPLVLELDEKLTGQKAWVKIGQVRTLAAERLTKRIGHAARDIVDKAVEGLNDIIS